MKCQPRIPGVIFVISEFPLKQQVSSTARTRLPTSCTVRWELCRRETVENLEKVESVCVSFSTSCDVLCKDLSLLGWQMRLSVERLRIWHISPSSECEDAKMPLAMLMMQYNTQLSGMEKLAWALEKNFFAWCWKKWNPRTESYSAYIWKLFC